MSDLISRSELLKLFPVDMGNPLWHFTGIRAAIEAAPTIDAVPVDIVADMLAYMFNDECPCNYNDIDEWLPYVCENTETCPDVVGKHSCWEQFIKHWMNREGEEE